MIAYLSLGLFSLAFCLVAKRLASTILTAPISFIGFGTLIATLGLMPEEGTERLLHLVAEVALILLLFLDAAKIDPAALRRRHVWPLRMLLLGLPLGFALGLFFAWMLLPGWPLAVVAVVAAILLPTDAALGQPVISNPQVPDRARRALTVESGLNDGMALPLVLIFASIAAQNTDAPAGGWLTFAVLQVTLGPLAGLIVGCIGGYAMIWAKQADITSDSYEGIGALSVAAIAYLSAVQLGGNGFLAAFGAGLGFGAVVGNSCKFLYEFTESEGQLVSWAAFFLLGALLVPEAIAHLTWPVFLLIITSLFIVRPLAIWLSLLGTDASPATRLFFGWFGPRGLATALFALLVVRQVDPEVSEPILHIAINAVWISAVLHGISAAPGARWYALRMQRDNRVNSGDATRSPMQSN